MHWFFLWMILLCVPSGLWAEPVEQRDLAISMIEHDEIDAQLLSAQEELKTAETLDSRREIKSEIRQLERRREELLDQMAQSLDGSSISFDQKNSESDFLDQLERHRQRRESILDDAVDGRLQ